MTEFFGTRNGKSNGSNCTLVLQRTCGLPQIDDAFARRSRACDCAETPTPATAISSVRKSNLRKPKPGIFAELGSLVNQTVGSEKHSSVGLAFHFSLVTLHCSSG